MYFTRSKIKKRVAMAFASALAMIAMPLAANAAVITIDFAGQIESLTTFGSPGAPALETVLSVGDSVTGTIVFDTDLNTVVGGDGTTQAIYAAALQSFTIDLNGTIFSATQGGITVGDDHMAGSAAPLRDSVIFDTFAPNISGPNLAGLAPDRLQFALGGADLSAINSIDLPTAAVLLGLIDLFQGNLNFVSFDRGQTARFNIASFTVNGVPPASDVPLPAAAWFMMTGIAGFTASRRKKHAKS